MADRPFTRSYTARRLKYASLGDEMLSQTGHPVGVANLTAAWACTHNPRGAFAAPPRACRARTRAVPGPGTGHAAGARPQCGREARACRRSQPRRLPSARWRPLSLRPRGARARRRRWAAGLGGQYRSEPGCVSSRAELGGGRGAPRPNTERSRVVASTRHRLVASARAPSPVVLPSRPAPRLRL